MTVAVVPPLPHDNGARLVKHVLKVTTMTEVGRVGNHRRYGDERWSSCSGGAQISAFLHHAGKQVAHGVCEHLRCQSAGVRVVAGHVVAVGQQSAVRKLVDRAMTERGCRASGMRRRAAPPRVRRRQGPALHAGRVMQRSSAARKRLQVSDFGRIGQVGRRHAAHRVDNPAALQLSPSPGSGAVPAAGQAQSQ